MRLTMTEMQALHSPRATLTRDTFVISESSKSNIKKRDQTSARSSSKDRVRPVQKTNQSSRQDL